jgi:hypothetical protein
MKKITLGITGTILTVGTSLGTAAGTASAASLSLIPLVTRVCDQTTLTALGSPPSAASETSAATKFAKNSATLASARRSLLAVSSSDAEESALVRKLAAQIEQQQAFYTKLQRLAKTRKLVKNWPAVVSAQRALDAQNKLLQSQLTAFGGKSCGFLPISNDSGLTAALPAASGSIGQSGASGSGALVPSALALRPSTQDSVGAAPSQTSASGKPTRLSVPSADPASAAKGTVPSSAPPLPGNPESPPSTVGQPTATTQKPLGTQATGGQSTGGQSIGGQSTGSQSTLPPTSTTGKAAQLLPNVPGLPLRPLNAEEQTSAAPQITALTGNPDVRDIASIYVGGDASAVAVLAEINIREDPKVIAFLATRNDQMKSAGFAMRPITKVGTFNVITGNKANQTIVLAARGGVYLSFLSNNPTAEQAIRRLLTSMG